MNKLEQFIVAIYLHISRVFNHHHNCCEKLYKNCDKCDRKEKI